MKDLNEVFQKLKSHLEQRDKVSGAAFAQDIVEAFQAISLRLAALEQNSTSGSAAAPRQD
jgi:hypothetical protein